MATKQWRDRDSVEKCRMQCDELYNADDKAQCYVECITISEEDPAVENCQERCSKIPDEDLRAACFSNCIESDDAYLNE